MLLLKWLSETVDLKSQDITNETWQTVTWEKTRATEGETLGLCGNKVKVRFPECQSNEVGSNIFTVKR